MKKTHEINALFLECYTLPSFRQKTQFFVRLKKDNGCFMDCDLDFIGRDQEPDCSINHFGYNFYFRTNAGVNGKKYKSFYSMTRAVKNMLDKNCSLPFICIGLINSDGDFENLTYTL